MEGFETRGCSGYRIYVGKAQGGLYLGFELYLVLFEAGV